MNDVVTSNTAPSDDGSTEKKKKPRYDWEDPTVPIGNAPAMPRWPAGLFAVAWVAWLVFLIVMLLSGNQAVRGA